VLTAWCLGCASAAEDVQEATAPPEKADVRFGGTPLDLPPRCEVDEVWIQLRDMLSAFNAGHGSRFAEAFSRPSFHPYSERLEHPLVTTEAIAAFIAERHEAGDRWTPLNLDPPQGDARLPREAIYTLGLAVWQLQRPGTHIESAAKVAVKCANGRVAHWVGPGQSPPGS
jgi:hypothetical protein